MSTYVPISTQTVGASAVSTVTFSGIPQTYTDLILVCNVKTTTTTNAYLWAQFNSDTASNYSVTVVRGSGSAAQSTRNSSATKMYLNYSYLIPTTFDCAIITQIQNYSNVTTNKTVLSRSNIAASGVEGIVGLWRSTTTAAITSITISTDNGGNIIDTGSTFTLYGIGSGSPKAFGGDIVVQSSGYWYHAFLSSNVFMPTQSLNVDILTIAGGAGGGYDKGGGGGAGAIVYATNQSLSSNTTIVVGAGGSGGVSGTAVTSGSNSTFGSIITADRGGKPDGLFGATSQSGGSGGGGGRAGYGGAATSYSGVGTKYGNAGGNGQIGDPAPYAGGGGGGSGANGGGAGGGGGGAGGAGLNTWSAWATATLTGVSGYYAGGGGGGTYTSGSGGAGGSGGGGAGGGTGTGTPGSSATRSTGSGGGGGGNVGNGGNGGSGIVIVRYAV